MVQSKYSLSWNSYKNSICDGFMSLQQNGEFVDMTLAADGHFVKVHQALLALASPYLKELIASAPCRHPVLFLNNVPHMILSLLLEYIYTGEVLVPSDSFSAFADAAKNLHIKGLENIANHDNLNIARAVNTSQFEDTEMSHVTGVKSMVIPTNEGTEQIKIPAAARKVSLIRDLSSKSKPKSLPKIDQTVTPTFADNTNDYTDIMDDNAPQDSDDDFKINDSLISNQDALIKDKPTSNLQFTVSIRGSLQVILNRYIYNLHSIMTRSGVRRWRCVEYRNHKCMAFLVTKDNIVLNRANPHNHPFHDKKILAKIEKKVVYSAIDDVQGYKEKKDAKASDSDVAMDHESYTNVDDGFN